MTIEVDLPSESFQLSDKPCFHQVDGTLVDTRSGLWIVLESTCTANSGEHLLDHRFNDQNGSAVV